MIISLIAAKSDNNVIGKNNDLPWHLSADMHYFKKTTTNHHIIMGRKTFESMKSRPLPNRTNIIISRNPNYDVPLGCILLPNVKEALKIAKENGEKEVFIVGGAQIYRQAIPFVDRMYITEIHSNFEGDTFFPEYEKKDWKEIQSEYHKSDDKNSYPYTFKVYEINKN